MGVTRAGRVYEALGVRPVINAMGNVTLLGGSIVSPAVLAAMAEANDVFVEMAALLDRSGAAIAAMLGAEAALVTSGAFAALAQGAAAVMTGGNAERIARLPDVSGMRHEFLIQRPMRYRYDRAASVSGARLIEAGTAQKATARDLERAIGPQTAGILYAARFEGTDGILPLTEVVALASAHGIAVLVDAAAELFPLERMTWLASKAGADLVCFGAKYFGAPQSAGVLCGKRALIEAAALNGFIAYETHDNRAWGRGYKVDRQEIVATVIALQEWFSADHQTRFAAEERRLQAVAAALAALPYVRTERLWPHGGLWHVLRVTFDEHAAGITPAGVHDALMRGDPPVVVRLDGDEILIAASTLKDGEEQILADRLRQALSGHR